MLVIQNDQSNTINTHQILNLNTDIVNRLVALKSLLELGDFELVDVASSRLEANRDEEVINSILSALAEHRYAEATGLIDKLLSEGTRVAKWIDPEIALMEAELEIVSTALADLETEQAELEHLIARFQAAHNEALGARIRKLLKLRLRWLAEQIKIEPAKQEAYDHATRDFEQFEQGQETQKENLYRSEWELSEDEQKELKILFRKGSKKCHPDLVSEEHRDSAASMFLDLRDAYDRGDLKRLKQLVDRVESGLFEVIGNQQASAEQKKNRLKAKITVIREALEKTKDKIRVIKKSITYQTIVEHENWADLLEEQSIILDNEIEKIKNLVENGDEN